MDFNVLKQSGIKYWNKPGADCEGLIPASRKESISTVTAMVLPSQCNKHI